MRRVGSRGKDSGYMLLVLMLAVAVLTITLLGVARNYRRSIVRDREVEMMHRGDQYSRAIKRYYKKNGSYPTTLEQLENTNKIRYLRKRYKDPMSPDGSWKLVHATDIKLTSGGLAGAVAGTAAGQNPANAGIVGAAASVAAVQSAAGSTGTSLAGTSTAGTDTGGTTGTGTPPGGTGTSGSTSTSDQGTASGGTPSTGSTNNAASSGQVLGGGPVLGVVSKSKAEGIHSFADKKKYNEWFFIYDPSQDRGQMLVGPYNPNMFLGAAGSGLGNPTQGTPGATGGGVGAGMSGLGASGTGLGGATGTGMGSPFGAGSSSNPPSTPAPSTPTAPPTQ